MINHSPHTQIRYREKRLGLPADGFVSAMQINGRTVCLGLFCLFVCFFLWPWLVRGKSTGKLCCRVVFFSQAALNPILYPSLRSGIWMTWSMSNQRSLSLAAMEFPTNLPPTSRAPNTVKRQGRKKGQVTFFLMEMFIYLFFPHVNLALRPVGSS